MRGYGAFLANLRSSVGLSLEELAKLVGTSKSTLSRLENDDIAQPFKGTIRKLILSLAQILCTSRREIERYLELAGINQSLLTDVEEIQLGFLPRITPGSPDEQANLERLASIYKDFLEQLEAKETEIGISSSPPNLKLKTQEYRNILQEIQKQLDRLYNRSDPFDLPTLEAIPAYYVETVEDRIVIGNEYDGYASVPDAHSLYALASDKAR